jgi:methylated-DNA-[protein]-cysteine S-methyltransferase
MVTESRVKFVDSPLGLMWLWESERGLCGAGFGGSIAPSALQWMARHGIDCPRPTTSVLLERAGEQLQAYFGKRREQFDLPLDLRGTIFQMAVWECLLDIPYADTSTYGAIALQVGSPRASRAVGQAVAANPLTILVPCHRVTGADGGLTGYGGGVERKAALLALEHAGLQLRLQLRLPIG